MEITNTSIYTYIYVFVKRSTYKINKKIIICITLISFFEDKKIIIMINTMKVIYF